MNWFKKAQELDGKARKENFSEKDANPKELEMGIKIEMEHTKDQATAKRIALDHLAEIGDYYSRLKKMEDNANLNK